MAELATTNTILSKPTSTSTESGTSYSIVNRLLGLLPKIPKLEDLKIPSIPLDLLATSASHLKYKDVLLVLESAIKDQSNPSAKNLEITISNIFKSNEEYKLLGLDKISDAKIHEGAESLRALASNITKVDKIKLITELVVISNHLISDLPKQDQVIINKKLAEEALKYIGVSTDNSKTYASLISTLISNADPKKLDAALEFAINASSKYSSEINPETVAKIFLGSPQKLSAELGLPLKQVTESQTCIADAFKNSILNQARSQGTTINMETLASILRPNTPLSLVDSNGTYSRANLNTVASIVTNNLLNNPQTQEEHTLRNRAIQTRETEHQQAVRSRAHQEIAQTRMGLFRGPHLRRQQAAHQIANRWTPGFNSGGFIGGSVTDAMNEGYNNTRQQANAQMRQGVFQEVRTQIDQSFSTLSKADQTNLKIVSDILSKTSDQTYASSVRVDDLKQVANLGTVAKSILNTSPTNEIDPLRITNYSIRLGQNGERYDVFQDTQSKDSYYRLTEKDGNVRYAKSTEPGKYIYIDKEQHSGVIKSLEIYEERLAKNQGEQKNLVAVVPSKEPVEEPVKEILPPLKQVTSNGIIEIADTNQLQETFSKDPRNRNSKIDISNFRVFSYTESDGNTSYALLSKNGAIGPRSIRNNQLQDYVLTDVYNQIKKSDASSTSTNKVAIM